MSILDKILNREQVTEPEPKKVRGKIIHLDDGWGFVSSKDIPYTRIFFHWSALEQDTLHFSKLENGMVIEFTPIERKQGLLAIKIRVIENQHDESNQD